MTNLGGNSEHRSPQKGVKTYAGFEVTAEPTNPRADPIERHPFGIDLLGDPLGKGSVGLQQEAEGAGYVAFDLGIRGLLLPFGIVSAKCGQLHPKSAIWRAGAVKL